MVRSLFFQGMYLNGVGVYRNVVCFYVLQCTGNVCVVFYYILLLIAKNTHFMYFILCFVLFYVLFSFGFCSPVFTILRGMNGYDLPFGAQWEGPMDSFVVINFANTSAVRIARVQDKEVE